eukprot:TRINITY_DN1683_c0_g2_i2.p1 TRINITY_DN1683_c0_g2~~TRINITY_DN1683_c0_g2_i2.p1  ORF type:complete len:294 (+),score=51.79 TRINITY_DN1683_c0_g2_i2:1222-2103(+)
MELFPFKKTISYVQLPLPPSSLHPCFESNHNFLGEIAPHLSGTLYIHYVIRKNDSPAHAIGLSELEECLNESYFSVMQKNGALDLVLIPPFNDEDCEIKCDTVRVTGPEVNNITPPKEVWESAPSVSLNIRQYDGVVVGGTFDYLHAGHKILLATSVMVCKRYMEIGVTTAALLQNKKYKEFIQPFAQRVNNVRNFVTALNPNIEYKILELNEPFGNTTTSPLLHAIVISPETKPICHAINEQRKERDLPPLDIIEVKYVLPPSETFGGDKFKMSSTGVRAKLFELQTPPQQK